MTREDLLEKISKLPPNSEIAAWWITKDWAEDNLLDRTISAELWREGVREFEELELREWEFIAEDLQKTIEELEERSE